MTSKRRGNKNLVSFRCFSFLVISFSKQLLINYWLKKEKYSCCTCSTNFRAFLCRTPQNNVKSPNFKFAYKNEPFICRLLL